MSLALVQCKLQGASCRVQVQGPFVLRRDVCLRRTFAAINLLSSRRQKVSDDTAQALINLLRSRCGESATTREMWLPLQSIARRVFSESLIAL